MKSLYLILVLVFNSYIECKVDLNEILKAYFWAGELAQWIIALVALAEDSGSIPSTHMAANSHP